MSTRNKHAVAAIVAMLSAGVITHAVQQIAPIEAAAEMRRFQVAAASSDGDWTGWGGALRGSPALRHDDDQS